MSEDIGNQSRNMLGAPFFAIDRHRIGIDGKGVRTLVGFCACPLRCKYCINPHSFAPDTKSKYFSPKELYEKVKIDQLYFLSSGGGVTFGGGEPLLYADFIAEFRRLCGKEWSLYAETSLNVPWENVQTVSECIDKFFIDCKDTNSEIYRAYTGKDNSLMLDNLRRLASIVSPERIVVRVPLIPSFNTEEDRQKSITILRNLGIENFDLFEYKLPDSK